MTFETRTISAEIDTTASAEFTELSEFNPWPSTLVSAGVQGVVIALVLIAAKLMGIL